MQGRGVDPAGSTRDARRGADMPISFDQPAFWHWLALGALMFALEFVSPGVIFLWLGVAAMAVGLVVFVVPGFTWQVQLIVFCIVAMVTTLAGRRMAVAARERGPRDPVPGRAERYLGRTFALVDTTLNGCAKVAIGDTLWPVLVEPPGTELFMGARVTVVDIDIDGTTLIVESFGDEQPVR
jgi:membrane protein implicated in regulation of membrane protease activity